MRKLVITSLICGFSMVSAKAQTLFTYGSKSVTKEEFLRVYKKNSLNKKPDMSDTALRSYLNLYSLFRMKVAEAEKQRLDSLEKIQNDLNNYRKQLAKNYLTDDQITKKLLHEAYDRMKEDVHVAHILVSCGPGTDTLAPSRKIDSLYKLLSTNKISFEDLARTTSDDKGSKDNGGDIGVITSLQTVFQFENAAYGTPVGKISKPSKTQFGYHIVKVLERYPDKGQIKVAQILIASPKSRGEEGLAAALKRADSVEAMIKAGVPFAKLVKDYSADQYSINDSGVLKPFCAGKYTPAFEKAAFALKTPGEVSAPVKTDYGYHIIKLVSKIPLAPFDSLQNQIKHRVENDARAQVAKEHFFNKVKEKNGFKEYPDNIKDLSDRMQKSVSDTGKSKGTFKAADYLGMNKPVFTMAKKTYTQYDFVRFFEGLTHGRLNGPKPTVVRDAMTVYENNTVTDFEERKLVDENPEFHNLMKEYMDGIMLFELMDRNVWSKATKDSAGLKTYYEAHKGKYMWEPGFEGSVYTFKNKTSYDTGIIMLNDPSMTDEQLVKILNTQNTPDRVAVQRGRYEFSKFRDATQAELKSNKMKTINMPNGSFKVVYARTIFDRPGEKSLDEARGYVVAEYQDFLEKQWNDKMHRDYPLKVNEAVAKTLSK